MRSRDEVGPAIEARFLGADAVGEARDVSKPFAACTLLSIGALLQRTFVVRSRVES